MLHLEGTPAPMVACPYECLRLGSFNKEAEMPTDFEELKRQLLQSNDEFRQLATLHHDLDERIHNLAARHTCRNQNSSKKSPSRRRNSS